LASRLSLTRLRKFLTHLDRDQRLAVEIVGHARGPVGGGHAAPSDSGEEAGKSVRKMAANRRSGPSSELATVLDHNFDADQSSLPTAREFGTDSLAAGPRSAAALAGKGSPPRSPAK